jgi:hypothetical protein
MWFKAALTAVLALWRRRNRKRAQRGVTPPPGSLRFLEPLAPCRLVNRLVNRGVNQPLVGRRRAASAKVEGHSALWGKRRPCGTRRATVPTLRY